MARSNRWPVGLLLVVLGVVSCELTGDRGLQPTGPPVSREPSYRCGEADADVVALAGTKIAANSSTGLVVVDPVTGTAQELPGYTFGSWSPDGTMLAATRAGVAAIFDRSPGAPILEVPSEIVSWSPDSQRLGYFIDPDFHVVDLATGDVTHATVCPDLSEVPVGHDCYSVEWSRAYDWIVINWRIQHFHLSMVARADGSEGTEDQWGRWSPDGRWLLLESGGEYDWNFRVVDGETRSQIREQAVAPAELGERFERTWESVCHLGLLFDYRSQPFQRVAWNLCEGGVNETLPVDLRNGRAAWTSDGQQVAYLTDRDVDGRQQLKVHDLRTDEAQVLCDIDHGTGESEFTFRLAALPWSPDQDHLLATVTDSTTSTDRLVLIAGDGSGIRWLPQAEESGVWAP